ncbi:GNAT family N-acetyltransferase [Caulobacter sp. KR2-114]|uniref:GNAT family N-acetyltransferase n=1 Tax=Caulobacter sp. KR2-114 TaxID=3400912 RepID=UPI003C057B29
MPDFSIRRATRDDLARLTGVDPRLDTEPGRAAHLAPLLDLGLSWVAEAQDRPLGYVVASTRFFDRPFVDLVVVAQDARRLGVGTALMAACEDQHDDDRLFTSTNESNQPMRALLAKAGYRVSGVIENLDPGDPELVFVKFRPVEL